MIRIVSINQASNTVPIPAANPDHAASVYEAPTYPQRYTPKIRIALTALLSIFLLRSLHRYGDCVRLRLARQLRTGRVDLSAWNAGARGVAVTVVVHLALLSGCASDPPKPDPVPEVSRPVVAEVGVRERCRVELPAEPAWLFTGVAADSLFDFYRRALAEIQQRAQHERELRTASKKCE